MKYYFLFLFFSLFIALSAKAEFYIESTSTGIVKIDGYDLPNGSKFSIFKGTYQWTNSLGYYGTATCKGLLEKEHDLSSINFLCESINQKGDKQYSIVKRKSVEDAGIGKAIYISGTGRYLNFINKECTYAVNYLNPKVGFYKQICKD